MKSKILILIIFLVTFFTSANYFFSEKKEIKTLSVSAAASLEEPLKEIGELFISKNPQFKLEFNFAGSKGIEQQILKGAPADVFISASYDSINFLIENAFTKQEKTKIILKNTLVLAAPLDSNLKDISDLRKKDVKTIGLGEPTTAPAGGYAKEALQSMELWEELSPKIVYTQNVRQVVALIETGNVDGGFIYQTDLGITKNIKKIADVPQETYTNVLYPAILLNTDDNEKEYAAKVFYDFLNSNEASEIFVNYGFTLP